jgi:hypothetical protein
MERYTNFGRGFTSAWYWPSTKDSLRIKVRCHDIRLVCTSQIGCGPRSRIDKLVFRDDTVFLSDNLQDSLWGVDRSLKRSYALAFTAFFRPWTKSNVNISPALVISGL